MPTAAISKLISMCREDLGAATASCCTLLAYLGVLELLQQVRPLHEPLHHVLRAHAKLGLNCRCVGEGGHACPWAAAAVIAAAAGGLLVQVGSEQRLQVANMKTKHSTPGAVSLLSVGANQSELTPSMLLRHALCCMIHA
jgi:hypothetical protein